MSPFLFIILTEKSEKCNKKFGNRKMKICVDIKSVACQHFFTKKRCKMASGNFKIRLPDFWVAFPRFLWYDEEKNGGVFYGYRFYSVC